MIESPGIYSIPAAEYHADPCPAPSLSASVAKLLVSKSPRHAWTAHPRLNPAYEPTEDTKFDLGSAAHAHLLEGVNRMVVIDADSYRTNAAKEARDEARAAGKHPVLKADYANVLLMRNVALKAIADCPDLSGITLADGKAEQSVIWKEGAVYCRARIDWLADDYSLILDLKTTAASANPDAWVRTMSGMDGEVQGAFNIRGVKAVTGKEPKFVFLVQEVDPPFACSFVGLPPAFLALGASKCAVAVEAWRQCLASNEWPAYTNRICWVDPPAYHQAEWEGRGPDALGIPYEISQLWEKQG